MHGLEHFAAYCTANNKGDDDCDNIFYDKQKTHFVYHLYLVIIKAESAYIILFAVYLNVSGG